MENKALTVGIKLSKEQEDIFNRICGCVRKTYNLVLSYKIEEFKKERKVYRKDLQKYFHKILLKDPDYFYLKEYNSNILKVAIANVETAFKNMKHGFGFPKFKKKLNKQVVRFLNPTCISRSNLDNGCFNFIKEFKNIQFETSDLYRNYIIDHKEDIKSIYLTKCTSGNYKASVTIKSQDSIKPLVKSTSKNDIVGIDLGIKTLATLSDGTTFGNLNIEKNNRKKLTKLQQNLSKKVGGKVQVGIDKDKNPIYKIYKTSKNKEKARKKLGKAYEKIPNKRNNYLHEMTTKIVNENQVIVLEDLDVKQMQTVHGIAKCLPDVSFSEFRRQIEYKALKLNKTVIIADKWFPSSKICNKCKHTHHGLTLNDREWTCPHCGQINDRDVNASLNLRDYGIQYLKNKNNKIWSWRSDKMLVFIPVSENYQEQENLDVGRESLTINQFLE